MIATVASCDSSFSMTSDPQQRHHHRASNSFSSLASSYSGTDVESLYDDSERAAAQQILMRPLAILATTSPEINFLTRKNNPLLAQHHRQESLSSQSSVSSCSSHQRMPLLPTKILLPDFALEMNQSGINFKTLQPRALAIEDSDDDTGDNHRRSIMMLPKPRKHPNRHRTLKKKRLPKQNVPTHRRISFDSLPTLEEMEGEFLRACSVQKSSRTIKKKDPKESVFS